MNFKPLALACAALVAVAATPAHADFTGAYGASQWTTSGTGNGSATLSPDGAVLTLMSADFTPDDSPGATTLNYSIVLAAATTISFDWRYVSDDSSSTSDPFGYAVNGASIQLSQNGQAGFVEQDGKVTLTLNQGDTFAFAAGSTDSIFGAATTTVTGFAAIAAVPEPASLAMMLAGLGLVVVGARTRR